jgi:hypothetical protein
MEVYECCFRLVLIDYTQRTKKKQKKIHFNGKLSKK